MKNRYEINVRKFIADHYTPYDGDDSFLADPTERTLALWEKLKGLLATERERGGMYDIDEKTISTITSHKAGYIDQDLEQIVGLQTDEPLKRAIMPFGGIRLVHTELKAYGRTMDEQVDEVFKYRKTHNDGVFDVYTSEMKRARHSGVITGLPDAYGRGRIIGDYRRLPLYGIDYLIAQKHHAKDNYTFDAMTEEVIRDREELSEQIRALEALKEMASFYGFDISKPATDTKEAIQWLYFAFLAATKEQNGAAMSLGRVSTFLDIYSERDLVNGTYSEAEIQ
ncbi:MAG: pyruvate formate lyase family protein, partial [Sphaerochaeta sp.]